MKKEVETRFTQGKAETLCQKVSVTLGFEGSSEEAGNAASGPQWTHIAPKVMESGWVTTILTRGGLREYVVVEEQEQDDRPRKELMDPSPVTGSV